RYRRLANIDETLDCLAATDCTSRYSVAWIDCLATGASLGRSVLMTANEARRDRLPAPLCDRALELPERRVRTVPFFLPGWVLSPWTVRLFNALYYGRHSDGCGLVDYKTFFFPLDSALHWNRIYGRRGFVQYQVLLPPETSRRALIRLLERVA